MVQGRVKTVGTSALNKVVTKRRTTHDGKPAVLFSMLLGSDSYRVYVEPRNAANVQKHFERERGFTVLSARPGRPKEET